MTLEHGTTTTAQPEHWVRLAGEDGDGSIEGFELSCARRALTLLKGNLGRTGLLELLRDEIVRGDAFLHDHVTRSAGQQTTGTTVLHASGISAAQFTTWLARAFSREDVLLAGHPEHYSIHADAGIVNIVETLGDQVCSFYMHEWDESVVADEEAPPDAHGIVPSRRSRIVLGDGTVIGSISNSFHEAPEGFEARLSVSLPVTCSPAVVEQHLEHFAVEFRNWILAAAAEQHAPAGAASTAPPTTFRPGTPRSRA